MSVITLTHGSTTFRRIQPSSHATSSTARSTCWRAKYFEPIASHHFEKTGCHGNSGSPPTFPQLDPPRPEAMQTRRHRSLCQFTRIRSLIRTRCRVCTNPFLIRSPQNRSQRRSRRTFAIGAGDQHAREAPSDDPSPATAPAYEPDRTCAQAFAPVSCPAQTCELPRMVGHN